MAEVPHPLHVSRQRVTKNLMLYMASRPSLEHDYEPVVQSREILKSFVLFVGRSYISFLT